MTMSDLVSPAVFAALGVALGLAYFWLLRANLRLFFRGRGQAVAVLVLRLAAAGTVFWLIAGWGAAALIPALAGFLAGRFLFLRWSRRQPC